MSRSRGHRRRGLALVCTVALALAAGGGAPATRAAGSSVVLVVVDDLDLDSVQHLDGILERVASRGVSFDNAFASQPLCCPSRTSMLLGQYTHNHRIVSNWDETGSCAEAFRDSGYEAEHVGNWFREAGYRTGFVGKYLNRYPGDRPGADPKRVPGGWDDFHAPIKVVGAEYYDYTLNENGELVSFGGLPGDYIEGVLADRATRFIDDSGGNPFFLVISTPAPHLPATPPPDHLEDFAGATAPRTPSFNEADMSDKPLWFRENLLPMSEADIASVDENYRNRLRSMRGVEDLLAQVDAALARVGQLESAYLVVISDHGFHQGHHRFRRGKDTAYEPSIRIPLMIRGPGIPVGEHRGHLVTNVDLPMTLAGLVGAPVPPWVDGRSLVPLLSESPPAVGDWRSSVLLEHPAAVGDDENAGIPSWWGLRTLDSSYVEYVTGEREYYDLRTDPDQLESLHDRADPALLDELKALLKQKLACGGADCG